MEQSKNSVTIFRGSHQIGGCATEIKTGEHRVLIDLGASLPGTENAGVSDEELLKMAFADKKCDGILFTHYHGDHIGLYNKAPRGIPLYIGATAKSIMEIVAETLEHIPGSDYGGLERIRGMKCYNRGKRIMLGDIAVTPLSVDHSALDSYMFLIEVGGKRILFTGDFREHGIAGGNDRLGRVLEKYVGQVDILITEGTMLSRIDEKNRNPIKTEDDLGKRAAELFRENRQSAILVSSTNFDSVIQFYRALPDDMELVCDWYQAKLLRTVLNDTRIGYGKYRPKIINGRPRRLHTPKDSDEFRAMLPKLQMSGFTVFVRENKPMFREILDMLDDPLVIYSKWTGYLKGKHHDPKITDLIGNRRMEILHTSGHAYTETIERVIKITNPKTIIPMHTECADSFAELPEFAPYRDKIKVLSDGERYFFE